MPTACTRQAFSCTASCAARSTKSASNFVRFGGGIGASEELRELSCLGPRGGQRDCRGPRTGAQAGRLAAQLLLAGAVYPPADDRPIEPGLHARWRDPDL